MILRFIKIKQSECPGYSVCDEDAGVWQLSLHSEGVLQQLSERSKQDAEGSGQIADELQVQEIIAILVYQFGFCEEEFRVLALI